jgi:hypothetical protein
MENDFFKRSQTNGTNLTQTTYSILKGIPKRTPFPIDALGPVLAGAATEIAERTQAPTAIAAQSVLAAAAFSAQRAADIELPTGMSRPISEFFVTITDNDEHNSRAVDIALEAFLDREARLEQDYDDEQANHALLLSSWERRRSKLIKDNAENHEVRMARELATFPPRPQPPLLPLVAVPEPDYHTLMHFLCDGPPTFGLVSRGPLKRGWRDEKAGLLSELWLGRPIKSPRPNDRSLTLRGRRVSMHRLIPVALAADMFNSLRDHGLLSYMLTAMVETLAGARYFNHESKEFSSISSFSSVIASYLQIPPTLAPGTRNELRPTLMRFADDAKRRWFEFASATESQLGKGGKLESVRGLASRAAEHAARLGAIIELLSSDSTKPPSFLSSQSLESGIALAQYYLSEALRIEASVNSMPELELAQKTLDWIMSRIARGHGDIISLPDLYQLGPYAIRDKAMAAKIVQVLLELGHIRQVPPEIVSGKLRREVYKTVVPEQPRVVTSETIESAQMNAQPVPTTTTTHSEDSSSAIQASQATDGHSSVRKRILPEVLEKTKR